MPGRPPPRPRLPAATRERAADETQSHSTSKDAGYSGFASGENIIAGTSTAEDAVNGWMDSDGHCHNIMADGPNETGIGYAFRDGSPFGHYATQLFGKR